MKLTRSVLLALVAAAFSALPARAQTQSWMRQFGTSTSERYVSAAPGGSGDVFMGFVTWGSLGGPNAGSQDVCLARFDTSGNQLWIRQFGTAALDYLHCAAPDGAGGVYIGGSTRGSLGGPYAGGYDDAWLARYDESGNRIWIRQLGTSYNDHVFAAASDASGGVYVGGKTEGGSLGGPNAGLDDAWLARYDGAGNQLWILQFGTTQRDELKVASSDGSGGVIIGGLTNASLGGPYAGGWGYDTWLARYDAAGSRLWILQFGTGFDDLVRAAASDTSGGVFVGGCTNGSLGGPFTGALPYFDAWLAHYDASGSRLWVRQFGTGGDDGVNAFSPSASGEVLVAGYTTGSLGGPNAGGTDAWLARHDSVGNQLWIRQFGTSTEDTAWDAVPDGSGGMYLGGDTAGSLVGGSPGGQDIWLARYLDVSALTYCSAGTTTNGCVPAISGTGTPSATAASGFTIGVANVEGQKLGLVFYGLDNASWTPLAWASGSTSYLCVKSPMQRMPSQNSGGTIGQCDGVLSIDWNAFRASSLGALGQPFAVGQHVYAQAWFRDPPAPKTTNLSDGLEFLVQP